MTPALVARAVLGVSALPFAGIGLAFLLAPAAMARHVDVSLASATANHDVRAVYGGLQLGCAACLALGAAWPAWTRAALAAQVLLYGGLAGARAFAWLVTGAPGPFGVWLHAMELLGLAAGALAWRRLGGAS